ncbi:MAG: ZIP family metal transporter [Clostridia bacterium]
MSTTWIIILGISITFIANTLGCSLVYVFKKKINPKINSCVLGFASGIMISASVFGLIMPAIEQSKGIGDWFFLPASIGLLMGCLLFELIDKFVPHIHKADMNEEGPKNKLSKSMKLFFAVLIHNIPEGLAVGIVFGNAIASGQMSAYISALGISIGVAIQNFPEGIAVSMPIKQETGNNNKAFFLGTVSGIVEPIFAIIALLISTKIHNLMPWLLAIAAGAMIFVTIEDLIPDAKLSSKSHIGSWSFIIGFVVMMILDIALA